MIHVIDCVALLFFSGNYSKLTICSKINPKSHRCLHSIFLPSPATNAIGMFHQDAQNKGDPKQKPRLQHQGNRVI
jgi:hypothetical protein